MHTDQPKDAANSASAVRATAFLQVPYRDVRKAIPIVEKESLE
jgi:hypothetical protein